MALIRWSNDPIQMFDDMQKQMDDLWSQLGSTGVSKHATSFPTTDVYTNDDKELVVESQLAGFNEDEIDVDVHNNVLEIKAQKEEKEESDKEDKKYFVRESSSSFYRSFQLPKHVDSENIEAHFEDGVLKIVAPFKELPEPKKISIKSKKSKK